MKKSHCNICQGNTNHEVLYCCERNETDEYHICQFEYSLIECRGCGSIKTRIVEFSDDCDRTLEGNIIPTERTFPPKTLRERPNWLHEILFPFRVDKGFSNTLLLRLVHEVYVSLQNDCLSLAAMGIRAILEQIMIEKCGDKGSFAKNLETFENGGFISKLQKSAITQALEVGNAAIHRSFTPSFEQLVAALDITENIIQSIYVLEKNERKASKGVPPRNI